MGCLVNETAAPSPPADHNPTGILSTLNEDGSRRWLKPVLSTGRLWRARRAVAYFLIALFTILPHLRNADGRPLFLLDLTTRHFTLFGYTFLPTDTVLLALFLVGVFVSIFLITAISGRVWCGWACPQTVYMEFLYRPIERFFDGAPGRAKKGPFQGKPLGKALKYVAFFAASCFLAHTFLAYFVPTDELREWITQSPLKHPGPFMVMAAVTGLMMFDFSFFREQTCLVACPYGRFQSVLLDRQSLIVSYDRKRGEPRGKATKHKGDIHLQLAETPKGDCVDCGLCVRTCPTGIDIRNGLQMECVNCTQCIDACDAVMTKLGRPTGLIRYGSQAGMEGEPRRRFRPRVIAYPIILSIIIAGWVFAFSLKSTADFLVLRQRGAPFVAWGDGMIANSAKVKVVNRTSKPVEYTLGVEGVAGADIRTESPVISLAAGEAMNIPVLLVAPEAAFVERGGAVPVRVQLRKGEEVIKSKVYRLVGPGDARRPNP